MAPPPASPAPSPRSLSPTVRLFAALGLAALVSFGCAGESGRDRPGGTGAPGSVGGGPSSPPLADDDSQYIIEPGNETLIQNAIRPLKLDARTESGWTLGAISIARGMIAYRLQDDDGRWVTVNVFHANDGTVPASEVAARDAYVQVVLDHPSGLPAEQAKAAAQPVLDRLLANSETLKDVWTPRSGHGAEPARAGARNAPPPSDYPSGTPDPYGSASDGSDPYAADSIARDIFTADNILIGVGVLLALLILASGLPAFLRRKKSR